MKNKREMRRPGNLPYIGLDGKYTHVYIFLKKSLYHIPRFVHVTIWKLCHNKIMI